MCFERKFTIILGEIKILIVFIDEDSVPVKKNYFNYVL